MWAEPLACSKLAAELGMAFERNCVMVKVKVDRKLNINFKKSQSLKFEKIAGFTAAWVVFCSVFATLI